MIIIIGAGITGLSFVNFLDSEDYIIFEAEEKPGGYCKTIKKDGFIWDFSGHFFHFRDIKIKNYVLSRMDSEVLNVNKKTQIFYNGKYIDYPFQKNIHQLDKDEFIDCLYDLYFRPKNDAKNFYEMLITKFGMAISEKFLIPYNEKLYACNLQELDKNAMGRFFPYADFGEVIKNFKINKDTSYNSSFIYPKDGAYEYVKAFLKKIDCTKLRLNQKVVKIDLQKQIVYTEYEKVKYDILVSTMPFNRLLDICGIPYDHSLYSSNKVLVFNLGFDKPTQILNHWIYYPHKEIIFYRVGFYNNIFSDKSRMSLYVEIGLKTNTKIDINSYLERVLEDLHQVNILTNQNLISWDYVIMNPAYVYLNENVLQDVQLKKELLSKYQIYSIGRYGSWTYCSIEDNIIEAKSLAKKIKEDYNI